MEEEKSLRRGRSRGGAESSSEDGRGSASRCDRSNKSDTTTLDNAPSTSTRWVGRGGVCKGEGTVSKFNEYDVLYVKGGAARTITHPGNLHFYRLCEVCFGDWFDATPEHRRTICAEIVDAIHAKGGTFRDKAGGELTHLAAREKTRDRMRQIGKPKIRPQGEFGAEDVVFVRGGANNLYPGNVKWKALVDEHILSYYREAVDEEKRMFCDDPKLSTALLCKPRRYKRKSDGRFYVGKRGERRRPAYQYEITDELIRIVHGRGGKFRDSMLNVLPYEEVVKKIHSGFRTVKKELIAGFRAWDSLPDCVEMKWKRAERQSKPKQPRACGVNSSSNNSDGDDDSFRSEMLESDSSGHSDSGDENSTHSTLFEGENNDAIDMAPKQATKQQQDEDRAERLKRRKLGMKTEQPQQFIERETKRRKGKRDECGRSRSLPPPPDRPLSEYELYRLKKIQRNQAKLAELGLLATRMGEKRK